MISTQSFIEIFHLLFLQQLEKQLDKKYHRKISTYVNILTECGFTIQTMLEPMPSDELVMKYPQFGPHKISPPMLIFKAVKGK